MARIALADALPDFGAPISRARPDAPEIRKKDSEERLKEAVAKAVAEAEAALAERMDREHEEKLVALRQRHEEEMQEAHTSFGKEAGAAVKTCFENLEQQVVAATSGIAARILGVAVSEELQKRAVGEFDRILREVLDQEGAVRIHVKGNAPLLAALKEQLGDYAARIEFTETPGFDISAEIDERIFETRLAEWSATLAEVLE